MQNALEMVHYELVHSVGGEVLQWCMLRCLSVAGVKKNIKIIRCVVPPCDSRQQQQSRANAHDFAISLPPPLSPTATDLDMKNVAKRIATHMWSDCRGNRSENRPGSAPKPAREALDARQAAVLKWSSLSDSTTDLIRRPPTDLRYYLRRKVLQQYLCGKMPIPVKIVSSCWFCSIKLPLLIKSAPNSPSMEVTV